MVVAYRKRGRFVNGGTSRGWEQPISLEAYHKYEVHHWTGEYMLDPLGNPTRAPIDYRESMSPAGFPPESTLIDLVALKEDVLLREAGPAPPPSAIRPSFDVGGGGEWILSAGAGFLPIAGEAEDVQEALQGIHGFRPRSLRSPRGPSRELRGRYPTPV